jgi:phosphatidylserine decarboxylase
MALSLLDTIRKVLLIKPHRAGYPFIGGAGILAVVLFFFSGFLGSVFLLLTLFCLYFFRDPARTVPQKPSLVVAPADGVISAIETGVALPPEISAGDGLFTRISVFLSVIDVHVNRNPVGGMVVRKVYKPGKFFNADLDKASEHNERCSAVIVTAVGVEIGVVQIAGLIARRIINDLAVEGAVVAGARFGLIRFGSRTDVYIPAGVAPLVCVGQRAIGGETVFADLDGHDAPRAGITL